MHESAVPKAMTFNRIPQLHIDVCSSFSFCPFPAPILSLSLSLSLSLGFTFLFLSMLGRMGIQGLNPSTGYTWRGKTRTDKNSKKKRKHLLKPIKIEKGEVS